MASSTIRWNPEVKLILSDLDETIADLYVPAVPAMIEQLTQILQEEIPLFIITGQGLDSIQSRVIDFLPLHLRSRVLLGHCSGVEVWGHKPNGERRIQPFYSVYEEKLNKEQKEQWRVIMRQLISEFQLQITPTIPVKDFKLQYGDNPLAVMYEDRGPQITFEFVNAFDLSPEQIEQLKIKVPQTHGSYDLRIPILKKAEQLLVEAKLPITPKLAGVFALDMVVEGVSKTKAVQTVLNSSDILQTVGLEQADLAQPMSMEIWGDKFSRIRGGSDRYMSLAVDPQVRSIDFRQENPEEFESGYNIVVWDGQEHLHHGLLEFLRSR